MKVKPAGSGKIVMEVGLGESQFLSRSVRSAFQLKRVLVPIDFSECSQKALQYAVAFAEQFQASLLLLYVVEIPYGTGDVGMVDLARLRGEMRASGEKRLAHLVSESNAQTLVTEQLIREGQASHEITQVAQEARIDLIVIATHGRHGLARFFLGSTAEGVVRHAPCPVLVVREREHEFVEAATEDPRAHRRGRPATSRSRLKAHPAPGTKPAPMKTNTPERARPPKPRKRPAGTVIQPSRRFGPDVRLSKP